MPNTTGESCEKAKIPFEGYLNRIHQSLEDIDNKTKPFQIEETPTPEKVAEKKSDFEHAYSEIDESKREIIN